MESHPIAMVDPNYENSDYSQNINEICDCSSYYEKAYSLFPRDDAVF
jgi:hypothetical protein